MWSGRSSATRCAADWVAGREIDARATVVHEVRVDLHLAARTGLGQLVAGLVQKGLAGHVVHCRTFHVGRHRWREWEERAGLAPTVGVILNLL